MRQGVGRCLGLLLLTVSVCAEPILIQPQNPAVLGTSLSNLRVRSQSADGTEAVLTVDFMYDGLRGPTARLLPVITDKKQANVSIWFGANPVTIGAGHGTISLKVKFFNDEPGVPSELTTDHVRVMMLSDGGNTILSQGIFSRTIKWGSPAAVAAPIPVPEPQAAEAARIKAEHEQRIAQERAKVEAEAKVREEADERAKADAEAKAQEQAHLKAVAEEKAREEAAAQHLAEEKAKAEAEAKTEAEAKAREEARLKAVADEKARQEAAARQLADEKTKADAEAKAHEETRLKAEAEAKRLAEEKAGAAAPVPVQSAAISKAAFAISSRTKSKVTNVDVVNRNMDRTEMTIAVEYQYAKEDGPVRMGVDFASTGEPAVSDYFSCPPVDIGKGSRNFVMLPVKLNAAAAQGVKRPTVPTDKVWVYVADASGQKHYIFQGTMMLVWHVPGATQADAPSATLSGGGNTLEIDTLKQNDLFSGYVSVKYNTRAAKGRLRLRIFDSANPATASWFASDDVTVKSGPGMELVKIAVPRDAASPDVFNADTVEITMFDTKGEALATVRKQLPMSWAKPK